MLIWRFFVDNYCKGRLLWVILQPECPNYVGTKFVLINVLNHLRDYETFFLCATHAEVSSAVCWYGSERSLSCYSQTSSRQREYTRESLNWKLHRTSAVLQRIKIRHAAQANALGAITAPVSGAGSIRERLSLDLSRRKAHCRGRIWRNTAGFGDSEVIKINRYALI